MEKSHIGQELETTKIEKLIVKYALPAILSGIVASLYNIIDQVFIGNIIGTEGNAATNVAFPLVTLITAFTLLISLGGTVNFSISIGRKRMDMAKKFTGIVLMGAPLVGLIISIITLTFCKDLLMLFGATADNYDLAYTYVNITAFGFPFLMATESSTKLIRADGAPKYAMVCSITGAILNCFLNPLLMIGFDMGITGAAIATVTGQVVSFVLAMRYFPKFRSFKIKFSEMIPDRRCIKDTLITGTSPFLNQMAMMTTQIVTNNIFSYYGALSVYGAEIPLACVGIITKVSSIYMATMVGFAQGAQPLFGFCYGSGRIEKVKEIYFKCIKYASIISVFVFLAFQIFPAQILGIFGAKDALYLEFGVQYFKVYMLMTFLNGIQPVTFNFFTSIGRPMKSSIVSLSKQLIFLTPLIILLPMAFGINGALYAGPIADGLSFLITVLLLRREMKTLRSEGV